jgi:hypothetical protein
MKPVRHPPRANVPPNPASPISVSRSMPLSQTPCVRGSRPVRIEARDGWQTTLGVMQAEKRVPDAAIMSRCGVCTLRPSKP